MLKSNGGNATRGWVFEAHAGDRRQRNCRLTQSGYNVLSNQGLTTPMTPNELQRAIEANTQAIAGLNQAVNFLVTEAIRPAAQQASANYERLESIAGIVADSAQQIAQTLQTLSSLAEQSTVQQEIIAGNTQAITELTQLAESQQQRLDAFDSRLEETRTLVAENASLIAQIGVKVDANASLIAQIGDKVDANASQIAQNASQIAQIGDKVDANASQIAQNASQIAQIGDKVDANAGQIAQLREAVEVSKQETEALKEITRSQLAGIIANARRIDRLEQQAS
jgi:chromosome segregation ATPase